MHLLKTHAKKKKKDPRKITSQYMTCLFILLAVSIEEQKIFDKVQISNLFFNRSCLESHLRKLCWIQDLKGFSYF